YYNAYYQNPYWAIGTNRNMDASSRLNANFGISYQITENIKWDNLLGVNASSGTGKNWRARQEYNEDLQPSHATVSSFVTDSEFQDTRFNGSSILTGDFDIQDDFSLQAIIGAQLVQN